MAQVLPFDRATAYRSDGRILCLRRAVVAKLVDAPDLGSGAERHLGSSPSDGTTSHRLCRGFPFRDDTYRPINLKDR